MSFNDRSESLTFRCICGQSVISRKHKPLSCVGNEICLFEMKEAKVVSSFVPENLMNHLKTKMDVITHTKIFVKMNKVLTDDEVDLVVHTCQELSAMGLGINEEMCLEVVNTTLLERIDVEDFKEVPIGVVKLLLRDNTDLLQLTKGNFIYSRRVCQYNIDVPETCFVKLENYIKILHSQVKVKQALLADLTPENIFNMDKVETYDHNQRKQIIADITHLVCLF